MEYLDQTFKINDTSEFRPQSNLMTTSFKMAVDFTSIFKSKLYTSLLTIDQMDINFRPWRYF